MRGRVWLLLALAGLATCDDPVASGPGGRPAAQWRLDDPPAFDLLGISGTAADALVAVGAGGEVLRYDGTQWTPLATEVEFDDRIAVWSTGPTEFFMADQQLGPDLRRIGIGDPAIHHCGTSGCTTYSDLPGDIHTFTDLWATGPDDVFAVGDFNGDILHFDGEEWSTMPGEIPGRVRAVWGFASDQVYAAGFSGVIYYDGVEWAPVATGGYTNLIDIWGSGPDDVFALDGDLRGFGSDLIHFDGTSWEAMDATSSATLTALWGAGPNTVYAVGSDGIGHTTHGVIYRYNGHSWSEMETPWSTPLEAIWGTSGRDVWAVGRHGMILHYDGFSWSVQREPPALVNTLQAVTGNNYDAIWAVGDYAVLKSTRGTPWTSQVRSADRFQYDVATIGADVVVVGRNYSEYTLTVFAPGNHAQLANKDGQINAIWCASERDCVVVGYGWIDRLRGYIWSEDEEYYDPDERLADIWGAGPDDIYAVGTTVVHFDGESWREVTVSRMGYELNAVWGSSGDDVFAVGQYGVIVHWNGREWRQMESGTYTHLFGVWGDSPRNVYAVGAAGTILHYDGELWTPVALPFRLTADLNDVWFGRDSDIIIVGEVGTILRGDR